MQCGDLEWFYCKDGEIFNRVVAKLHIQSISLFIFFLEIHSFFLNTINKFPLFCSS